MTAINDSSFPDAPSKMPDAKETKMNRELKILLKNHYVMSNMTRRPGRLRAAASFTIPFALIGGAIAIAQAFPGTAFVAAAFIATRYRQIANQAHWSSHYSGCADKRTNELLYKGQCVMLGIDPQTARADHTSHHAHLGNLDMDRDFGGLRDFALHARMGPLGRLKRIARLRLLQAYMPRWGFDHPAQALGTVLDVTLLASLGMAGIYVGALAWLGGKFLIYPVARHLYDLIDHGGIYHETTATRNCVIDNWLLACLLLPENDCFHANHHDFPYLAASAQKRAHAFRLTVDEGYAARTHGALDHLRVALKGFLK